MRELLERLPAGTPPGAEPLTHVEELPERVARTAPWPSWVPDVLVSRLATNIAAPWIHQVAARRRQPSLANRW